MGIANVQAKGVEVQTLQGVLERMLFFNEENQYCIGDFRAEGAQAPITIAGSLPAVQCGETLLIEGQWTVHPKYGRQFKVARFESKLPSSVYGIRKYLGSGLVPGIGKGYANKIVDCFGEDTLNIISQESARLKEVPGIGPQRAKSIKKAWDSQQALREVMLFLKTYGVGTATCLRLVKTYGDNAHTIMRDEPYRVAREVRGIGFKTADKIALNLGFSSVGEARLDAGILFAFAQLEEQGHTCASFERVVSEAVGLLLVEARLVEVRLEALVNQGNIVFQKGLYQLQKTFKAESTIAKAIGQIASGPSALPPIAVDKAVQWAQEKAGFTFAPEQAVAISEALTHKLSILTGGPGTGKTTILKALVSILKVKKVQIVLAAPTGRAAQRMYETTGAYAQTIHRLLQYDASAGRFEMGASKPLKADFVIVDEASMLDTFLAASLFASIPQSAHVLLVGDVHQLPAVGAGNVLGDCIHSEVFAVTHLAKIFRQKERSQIVHTAHAILQGSVQMPTVVKTLEEIDPLKDLHFISVDSPQECVSMVGDLQSKWVRQWYPKVDPLMDVQVLAPMHKGSAGIAVINQEVQSLLSGSSRRGITLGQYRFGPSDKVIQLRNNYDKNIFNGDMGRVEQVDGDSATMDVRFDRELHTFLREDMADLALAYAISIHKSQGSEFPVVIIPLLKQHFIMLARNLIYTAITRGRKKVFIVGDPTAYAMAVKNAKSTERVTGLCTKLIEFFKP